MIAIATTAETASARAHLRARRRPRGRAGNLRRVWGKRLPLRKVVSSATLTGHDHVDSVGLIHMGGRTYDPELGRFMQVDPFIQSPFNSQSLNPYSYIMNNPVMGTDPTGYMADSCGLDKFSCGVGDGPFGYDPAKCRMCVSTEGASSNGAENRQPDNNTQQTPTNEINSLESRSIELPGQSYTDSGVTESGQRYTVSGYVPSESGDGSGGTEPNAPDDVDYVGGFGSSGKPLISSSGGGAAPQTPGTAGPSGGSTGGSGAGPDRLKQVSDGVAVGELMMGSIAATKMSILHAEGPMQFTQGMGGHSIGVAGSGQKALYPLAAKAGKVGAKLGMIGLGLSATDTTLTYMRNGATNVEKGAATATFLTGVALMGIGAMVSAPVALAVGLIYFGVDQVFDVKSLYTSAINGLSGVNRREEEEEQ